MYTSEQKLSQFTLVLSMLMTTVLLGCVTSAPVVDKNFGNAVNTAKAQQVINPDAGLNVAPPDGVSGQPANAAIDRYHRSFERPPVSPNVFTIGVGSGGMTGGSGSGGSGGGTR